MNIRQEHKEEIARNKLPSGWCLISDVAKEEEIPPQTMRGWIERGIIEKWDKINGLIAADAREIHAEIKKYRKRKNKMDNEGLAEIKNNPFYNNFIRTGPWGWIVRA